jgi:RNA polymerase sigma factor (sigma-70 family)
MSVYSKVSEWFPVLPAQDEEQAWDGFLDEYAPVILQVVHHFVRDQDQVHDCFVFACEKLKQDNLKKIRRFEENGSASFPTWLRAVVRNLCLDWYRQRFGRPRLYRSIARLPKLEREIFRCIHLRGLSETEAFHTVETLYPSLTPSHFADCLVHIQQALSHRQSWLLATSTPKIVSLSNPKSEFGGDKELDIPDFDHDPEEEVSRSEYLAALRWALGHLSKQERLLIRLRFEQELTLEQIAQLTALGNARAVQGLLHKAVARVREQMTTHIAPPVSVKDS